LEEGVDEAERTRAGSFCCKLWLGRQVTGDSSLKAGGAQTSALHVKKKEGKFCRAEQTVNALRIGEGMTPFLAVRNDGWAMKRREKNQEKRIQEEGRRKEGVAKL